MGRYTPVAIVTLLGVGIYFWALKDQPSSTERALDLLAKDDRMFVESLLGAGFSSGLGFINIALRKRTSCLMHDVFNDVTSRSPDWPGVAESGDRPDERVVNRFLEELPTKMGWECAIYTHMHDNVRHILSEHRASNGPNDAPVFFFSILEQTDEMETFRELELGPFSTIWQCGIYEYALRLKTDLPTRKCQMRPMSSRRLTPPLSK